MKVIINLYYLAPPLHVFSFSFSFISKTFIFTTALPNTAPPPQHTHALLVMRHIVCGADVAAVQVPQKSRARSAAAAAAAALPRGKSCRSNGGQIQGRGLPQ